MKKKDLFEINMPQDDVVCNCRVCGIEKVCEIEKMHIGFIRICKSCREKNKIKSILMPLKI